MPVLGGSVSEVLVSVNPFLWPWILDGDTTVCMWRMASAIKWRLANSIKYLLTYLLTYARYTERPSSVPFRRYEITVTLTKAVRRRCNNCWYGGRYYFRRRRSLMVTRDVTEMQSRLFAGYVKSGAVPRGRGSGGRGLLVKFLALCGHKKFKIRPPKCVYCNLI